MIVFMVSSLCSSITTIYTKYYSRYQDYSSSCRLSFFRVLYYLDVLDVLEPSNSSFFSSVCVCGGVPHLEKLEPTLEGPVWKTPTTPLELCLSIYLLTMVPRYVRSKYIYV